MALLSKWWVDEKFGGLVEYNGAKYLVQNGKINWDYTGLVLDNGTWRFVQGGCLNEGYTGLNAILWNLVLCGEWNIELGYTGLANLMDLGMQLKMAD